jgi:hypothetical protein
MQAPDGSFPLFTRSEATAWMPCGSLFSTAYVMMGAGGLLSHNVIARAVNFIRSNRRADGLWDFDTAIAVPPDADTTACALAALVLHGEISNPQADARLLRTFWRADAGRFRCWNTAGIWSLPERDDPVANCNVLFALRLLGAPATAEETRGVVGFLRQSGRARYYWSPATIAHAARRQPPKAHLPPPQLAARPHEADLLGCIQWQCGMQKSDAGLIGAVLAAQSADGSWPIRAWVTGAGKPKPFWGSPAITTALAVEALAPLAQS